jgi:hypothetical protein
LALLDGARTSAALRLQRITRFNALGYYGRTHWSWLASVSSLPSLARTTFILSPIFTHSDLGDNFPQHSRNARRPTSSPTPQPQAGPSQRTTVPPRSVSVSSRPRAGTPPRSLLCAQPPRTGVTNSPRANVSSNQSAGPFRRTTVPPRPVSVSSRPRAGTPPRSLPRAQPPRTGVTISPRVNVSSNQSARRSQNTNQRTLPTGQAAAPVLLLTPESALEAHERVTPDLERTGLCIICQDEEATMAAVDCGYAHSRTLCCR